MSCYKDLLEENQRLRELCYKHGICMDCGNIYEHDLTEPFANCGCGTSEWSSTAYTPYMELQKAYYLKQKELTDEIVELTIKYFKLLQQA